MSCPASLETTLGELGNELLAQLNGRRYPLGGSFELTERCNLRCVHCYINQPAGDKQAISRELTLRQVKQVLDQLANAGCLFLLLTGGEVLLRPDFKDIYLHTKRKGIIVSLFTNGTLLTQRKADFLAEYRPHLIEITLYGATQEVYERVTGVAGSFSRCMNGIQLLLERGLRLSLKSVLMRANSSDLEAMKSIAESFGVPFRFDGMLWPRLDGDQSPIKQRLTPSELIALDNRYPERLQEWEEGFKKYASVPVRTEYVYSCGAGSHSFHINAAGQLSLCMMGRQTTYDLLQGSFQDGWVNFIPGQLKKKRLQESPCTTCSAGVLCTQCPAWSQAVHGDDESVVEFVCEIGRRRASLVVDYTSSLSLNGLSQ